MTFRIALSGLDAASTDLAVTSNNIANASTTGFKESRAEFADVYSSSVLGASSTATGQGVRVARIAQQFEQGVVEFTSNNLDLAINGEGFYVLEDPNGTLLYTRAGAFSADRDGYVVNHANQRLQVYPATTTPAGDTIFNTGFLTDLQLPSTPSTPNPTTSVVAALNLDASQDVPSAAVFSPLDATSYNHSTSITVYDSLGTAHQATMYFRKTADNNWNGYLYVGGTSVTYGPAPGSAAFPLEFDTSGTLIDPATGSLTLNAHTPPGGAGPMTLTLDFSDATQYGSAFSVNNLNQDGYASGRLSGVDIDSDGIVFARYTNGQSLAIGRVALAKFNNPQGLRPDGDTNWVETFPSGNAQLGEANTSSFGSIQSGALESSTVDIAEQLVNLIMAQRNFQANAQVITTADAITQTVINIR
jgi:flagellar hook protein FlgE